MKSMRENEVQKTKKPKRLCRYCNEYGYHDKRNCPKKEEEKKSGVAQKDDVQTDTADDVYSDDFDGLCELHMLIVNLRRPRPTQQEQGPAKVRRTTSGTIHSRGNAQPEKEPPSPTSNTSSSQKSAEGKRS
ncbi:hypothetical protein QQ045_015843 [Rhodiola kirilowii]